MPTTVCIAGIGVSGSIFAVAKREDQKSYYEKAYNLLKDFYTNGGEGMGFEGVMWYELTEKIDDSWWGKRNPESNFGLIECSPKSGVYPANGDIKPTWWWLYNL